MLKQNTLNDNIVTPVFSLRLFDTSSLTESIVMVSMAIVMNNDCIIQSFSVWMLQNLYMTNMLECFNYYSGCDIQLLCCNPVIF